MAEDPVINDQIEDWLRESKGNKPTVMDQLLVDLNLFAQEQRESVIE